MLCREIIAVCCEVHSEHVNAVCGQNTELLNVTAGVGQISHYALRCLSAGLLSRYMNVWEQQLETDLLKGNLTRSLKYSGACYPVLL